MKFYGVVITAVTELVVTVLALLFVGRWTDSHFQTGIRYTAVGAILGALVGFTRMIMRLKVLSDADDDASS